VSATDRTILKSLYRLRTIPQIRWDFVAILNWNLRLIICLFYLRLSYLAHHRKSLPGRARDTRHIEKRVPCRHVEAEGLGIAFIAQEGGAMRYVRVFSGPDGESHFEDVAVAFTAAAYAPPAPPLQVSVITPATQFVFVIAPAGWEGGWHPTPARQWAFILTGEFEVEVSDGAVRHFAPGSVLLLEDRAGRGHQTRVLGQTDVLLAFVHVVV
jgi:hypothetical protein